MGSSALSLTMDKKSFKIGCGCSLQQRGKKGLSWKTGHSHRTGDQILDTLHHSTLLQNCSIYPRNVSMQFFYGQNVSSPRLGKRLVADIDSVEDIIAAVDHPPHEPFSCVWTAAK